VLDTNDTVALPCVVVPVKKVEHAGIVADVPGAFDVIGTNVSEIEIVPVGVPIPPGTAVDTLAPKVAALKALCRTDVLAADTPRLVGA
jgi:hypothetical protein